MDETAGNRLKYEMSPYLLQHANNPVNWYPWGEEAHRIAKKKNIPIFLSIGYSACHWCHVMEKESFMDSTVADLLNTHFISIKVDRQERPDIDRIYMNACQLMTGSGGWPLSIFLTPSLRPFYAATYIPKTSRATIPGMTDILPYLARIWSTRPDEAETASFQIIEALRDSLKTDSPTHEEEIPALDEIVRNAYQHLTRLFDPINGGFANAPKFPSISQIIFLFRYSLVFKEKHAAEMARKTLQAMAYGGIRDQIGYGFHRYATDIAWKIPHFEKMLYDQAVNAIAYTEGWQIHREQLMKNAALDSLHYMCTTLKNSSGGFFSSEDADSEGQEGAFYLWNINKLQSFLSPEEFQIAQEVFDISGSTEQTGIPKGLAVISRQSQNRKADLITQEEERINQIRTRLFQEREKRQHPRMDDTILTDWNGIAIEALAKSFKVFNESWLIINAEEAASFLLSNLITPDGKLFHQWRAGKASVEGTAQDYIYAASGLVHLFQATGKPVYLKNAIRLCERANEIFSDSIRGGFYATSDADSTLPVRLRDEYDGPIPSVNGHAYQLLRLLAAITSRTDFADQADRLHAGMIQKCAETPLATLSFLGTTLQERMQIVAVIVGEANEIQRGKLWKILSLAYYPGLITIPIHHSSIDELKGIIEGVEAYITSQYPTVHICAAGLCRPPIHDPEELKATLDMVTRF